MYFLSIANTEADHFLFLISYSLTVVKHGRPIDRQGIAGTKKIWCWQCGPACTDQAFKNPHPSPFEFKIFPPTRHCAGTAHFQPSFWGILTFQQRGCHHREAKVEEHWLEQLCSAQKMWCRRFWIPWCLWFDWVAFSDRGWDSRFDPMCVN